MNEREFNDFELNLPRPPGLPKATPVAAVQGLMTFMDQQRSRRAAPPPPAVTAS